MAEYIAITDFAAKDLLPTGTPEKVAKGADLQAELTAIAAAIASKANTLNPTFTGTVTLPQATSIGPVSATEIGYLDGVTSAIQTQLNAKQATLTGAASTIASADLTASRALVSDDSGKVAVSSITATKLGYLSGVTSDIQAQINAIAASAGVVTFNGRAGVVTLTSGDVTDALGYTPPNGSFLPVSGGTLTDTIYAAGGTYALFGTGASNAVGLGRDGDGWLAIRYNAAGDKPRGGLYSGDNFVALYNYDVDAPTGPTGIINIQQGAVAASGTSFKWNGENVATQNWVGANYSASNHTHAFGDLTSKPTTISGYGITDFNSLGDARWSALGHTHSYLPLSGGVVEGRTRFAATSGVIANSTGDLGRLVVQSEGASHAAYMEFIRPGAWAGYFGLDTDNAWKVGGYSAGAVSYRVVHEGLSAVSLPGTLAAASTIVAGSHIHAGNDSSFYAKAFGSGGSAPGLWLRNSSNADVAGFGALFSDGVFVHAYWGTGATAYSGRMTMDASGNVTNGGAFSSSGSITTAGSLVSTGGTVYSGNGTGDNKGYWMHSAYVHSGLYSVTTTVGLYDQIGGIWRWHTDGAGNFTATGNVTAYSDARVKANVRDYTLTPAQLAALRLVEYDRTDIDRHEVGVIAQEVEAVAPWCVVTGADGGKSVDYGRLAVTIALSQRVLH